MEDNNEKQDIIPIIFQFSCEGGKLQVIVTISSHIIMNNSFDIKKEKSNNKWDNNDMKSR